MSTIEAPLVSVVTPVYNGAEFLEACIQSVLTQTYKNFEYIIVNNCSTDRTLEIAAHYAGLDSRIRLYDNAAFLGVIQNHNYAFSLMATGSRYCKVVSADDLILPECLEKMVALADGNPSVAMVGAYLLAGTRVLNTGLDYEARVVSGRQICRATLLGGPYVFGSPSSLMYRADLVRQSSAFYPTPNPHADTSACYRVLQDADFGFVHQVLAYAQIHSESQTSRSMKYGTIRRATIADLVRYGPVYLTREEVDARLSHLMGYYYRWLVGALVTNRGDPQFWPSQQRELEEVGIRLSASRLSLAALQRVVEVVLHPQEATKKVLSIVQKDPTKIEARYY